MNEWLPLERASCATILPVAEAGPGHIHRRPHRGCGGGGQGHQRRPLLLGSPSSYSSTRQLTVGSFAGVAKAKATAAEGHHQVAAAADEAGRGGWL